MTSIIIFFTFVFGTIIGSFLNVVILRYGTGKKILGMGERSMCFSCGKTLEWYELLPVVSFIFLRGKCSECKTKISWQYPLVEIATGIIFASIFYVNFGHLAIEDFFINTTKISGLIIPTLFEFAVWAILIVITVYDWRHKIIPDALVYAFSALSLIFAYFFPGMLGTTFLGSVLSGIGFFCFFAGLWLISGGRWLGFGDAKLVLGVGFLLGLVRGLSAMALSFWIGAVVSLGIMAWQHLRHGRLKHRVTMKTEIPFAPFIILGTLIAFFCYVDMLGITSFL